MIVLYIELYAGRLFHIKSIYIAGWRKIGEIYSYSRCVKKGSNPFLRNLATL